MIWGTHSVSERVYTFNAALTSRWAPPGTRGGFFASPVLINCPFDKATYVSFCTAAMNRVLVLPTPSVCCPPPQRCSPLHQDSLAIRISQTKPTFIHGQHLDLLFHRRLFRTILDPMSPRLAPMTNVFWRRWFSLLHLGLLWAILNEVLVESTLDAVTADQLSCATVLPSFSNSPPVGYISDKHIHSEHAPHRPFSTSSHPPHTHLQVHPVSSLSAR